VHHAYVDQLAHRASPIHALDPRAKVGVIGLAVVAISLTGPDGGWQLGCYALVLVALVGLARLPVAWLLRRVALVLPFVLGVVLLQPFTHSGTPLWGVELGPVSWTVTAEGLLAGLILLAKAALAALAVLVLVSTTRFPVLLAALQWMGLPRVLLLVLSFLYRYLFVLVDEAMRMRRAAAARGGLARAGQAGALLGSLFLRTYTRAERVYQAMLARGFRGQVVLASPLRFRARDGGFTLVGSALVVGIALWGLR